MIGSSDYHEVLTGSLLRIQDTPRTVNNRHMQARCGLAAVRGQEVSRANLFASLKNRRAYATSGTRGYLDFRVKGCKMGGELTLSWPDQSRCISLAAVAPEAIVKLEIVRNGDVIADLADGGWCLAAELEDDDALAGPALYYLRLTTERTEFAWSSPVWVGLPGDPC